MQKINSTIISQSKPVTAKIMCSNVKCNNVVALNNIVDVGVTVCEKTCGMPECNKFIRSPHLEYHIEDCNHDFCKRFMYNGEFMLSEISIVPIMCHYSRKTSIGSFAILSKIKNSKSLFGLYGGNIRGTNCVLAAAIGKMRKLGIPGFGSGDSIEKFNEFFFSSKKDYRYEITPSRGGKYCCIFYGNFPKASTTVMNELSQTLEHAWFSFPKTTLRVKNNRNVSIYSKKITNKIIESTEESKKNQKLDNNALYTLCLLRLRMKGK
jgi:hypothetical protein